MKINFCEVIIKVKIFIRHIHYSRFFFHHDFFFKKKQIAIIIVIFFAAVCCCCCWFYWFFCWYIFWGCCCYYSCCCCLFLLVDFDFFFDYLLGFWLGVCWSYNFWIFPAPNFQNPCCSHWLFKAFSHFSSWSRYCI